VRKTYIRKGNRAGEERRAGVGDISKCDAIAGIALPLQRSWCGPGYGHREGDGKALEHRCIGRLGRETKGGACISWWCGTVPQGNLHRAQKNVFASRRKVLSASVNRYVICG